MGESYYKSPGFMLLLNPCLYGLTGMTVILPEIMNLYVIASDPGTITMIQGVGFALWEPGSFHL